MKKILFFTVLLCVLSCSVFAKPYVPSTDSEGTLLILKKYRDVFNDKYGIVLVNNNEILSEGSDNEIKAKTFLLALEESGYTVEETLNLLLDKYRVSFTSPSRYKSYPDVIAFLFKISSTFIISNTDFSKNEYDMDDELFEKIDFYLNFYSYINKFDENIIKENEKEVHKTIHLMEKYWNNELFKIRMNIFKYFGMFGVEQNKKEALDNLVKIIAYTKKHKLLSYENQEALSAILLYDQIQQDGFTWSKANSSGSDAADSIAALYALYHTDKEVINKMKSLASSYRANDFSSYVGNMISLEIRSGSNFYKNFVSLRDEARRNLVGGWTRKKALELASKNSLAGMIFYCVTPKEQELIDILNDSSEEQKDYIKKFDNFLKSLNFSNLKGFYEYNKNNIAVFNIKINSNNDSLSATISKILPKIEKVDTIKAIGSINRRAFAFNAIELDTNVSSFMYGRKMILSLQPDGNLVGMDDSGDARIELKFSNIFLKHASKGDITEVTRLLNSGTDPNISFYTGRSAFSEAARSGHLEIVKLLFEKGANMNSTDIYGTSALHLASEKGHADVVQFLLDNNADVNTVNNKKTTSLMWASFNKNIDVIKILLKHKADVNLQNINGWTALLDAVSKGHTDVVTLLLEHGANINLGTVKKWTPLMSAIAKQNFEMTKLLLNNGADVSAINGERWSTLMLAAFYGDADIVKLLLENSANVKYNASGLVRKDAITTAQGKKNTNALEVLNKAKNIQAQINLLHEHAYAGTIKPLESLIKSNVNVDGKNEAGETALMIAARNGYVGSVKLLLENGANAHIKSPFGVTALKIAMDNNHQEIVQLLENTLQSSAKKVQSVAPAMQELQKEEVSKGKTVQNPAPQIATVDKLSEKASKDATAVQQTNVENSKEKATSQTVTLSTGEASKQTAQITTTVQKQSVAPAFKKPGSAVIVPTSQDIMSLTAFVPDQKTDSCVQVIAYNKSPLMAVRLESMGATSASWKTKDVKVKAEGVLAVLQDGNIINAADASFILDVAKQTPLLLCVQDTGAISDTKTRMRVIFFHQDGSRSYSILER